VTNTATSNTERTTDYGGGIRSVNSDSFYLTSSVFENLNFAKYGGAIHVSMDTDTKSTSIPSSPTHVFDQITFTNNDAYDGGALYISGVDYAGIYACTFTSNSAKKLSDTSGGKGGGIHYSSSGNFLL
jgi:predicted outer membrane repeat protein